MLSVRAGRDGGTAAGAVVNTVEELLRVEGLTRRYRQRRGFWAGRERLTAVDRVGLSIGRGETLGLVGESGSGKTTVARLILRLEEADGGRIFFEGEDWLAFSGARLRRKRRDLQIVFQDPQTSLNPRLTIGDQIAEPLRVQGMARRRELPGRVAELLAEVGLSGEAASRFPSEFSGGQRQRIALARAIATRPKLLVCDEPVSALDVSVAAQVINLFLELRRKNHLSSLFISHDLAVVARVSDRISVMYAGRIVEEGSAADITTRPLHPYTAALLSAVPDPDPFLGPGAPASSRRASLPDTALPTGCAFHPRCPIARPRCREETPALFPLSSGRTAACFYPGELAAGAPAGEPSKRTSWFMIRHESRRHDPAEPASRGWKHSPPPVRRKGERRSNGMRKFPDSWAVRAAAWSLGLLALAAGAGGQDRPVVPASPGQRTMRPLPAVSQGGIRLSLEEALGLAVANNQDLNVSVNAAEASRWLLFQNQGIFDPLLQAALSRSHSEQPASSTLAGALVPTGNQVDFSTSVQQLAPTGGLFVLGFTGRSLRSNSTFASVNPAKTGSLQLSLNQPLLRNLGYKTTTWLDQHRARCAGRHLPGFRAERPDDRQLRRAGVLGSRLRPPEPGSEERSRCGSPRT